MPDHLGLDLVVGQRCAGIGAMPGAAHNIIDGAGLDRSIGKDRPRRIASRAISSSGPNLDSKIYHFSGHKDYGHTKEGAYMCEKDALGQGIRAAKNEKHP